MRGRFKTMITMARVLGERSKVFSRRGTRDRIWTRRSEPDQRAYRACQDVRWLDILALSLSGSVHFIDPVLSVISIERRHQVQGRLLGLNSRFRRCHSTHQRTLGPLRRRRFRCLFIELTFCTVRMVGLKDRCTDVSRDPARKHRWRLQIPPRNLANLFLYKRSSNSVELPVRICCST
jgi:hypothetical protein